jgi:hypothetical protein
MVTGDGDKCDGLMMEAADDRCAGTDMVRCDRGYEGFSGD